MIYGIVNCTYYVFIEFKHSYFLFILFIARLLVCLGIFSITLQLKANSNK